METQATSGTAIRVVRYSIDTKALSPTQVKSFSRHAGCARQAWNWATAWWNGWHENQREHVHRLAVDRVGFHLDMSADELGDALVEIHRLVRGEAERKEWRDAAYADARRVHGNGREFSNARTLRLLYLRQAEHPDSEHHWWHREGARQATASQVAPHGVSTYAYQTTLDDFAGAIKAFWDQPRYSKRNGRRLGHPQFKKGSGDQSFAIMNLTPTNNPWRVIEHGHRVRVPNIGSIRVIQNTAKLRRLIKHGGRPSSARITRRGGKWFISINVQIAANNHYVAPPPRPSRRQRDGGRVGVDLGVVHLATLSTGEHIPNPRHLRHAMDRLIRLQRKLDRQHRAGSPECFDAQLRHKRKCRWGKEDAPKSRQARTTQRQIGRLHDLLARQRAGTLHEITKRLSTDFAQIQIEDLGVKNMTGRAKPKPDPDSPGQFLPNKRRSKSGLNRAILDAGFGEFRRQMTYKAEWYGSDITMVPAPGTSQTRHRCRHNAPENRESQAVFRCVACGHVANADINAACNIRDYVAPPTESQTSAGVGGVNNDSPTPGESLAEQTPSGVNGAREGPLTPQPGTNP